MQKLILFLSLILVISSCKKETIKNYDSENETEIQKYLETNNLQAEKTESGLYYIINKQGDGLQPKRDGDVIISYKATYTNDKLIEESDEYGYAYNLQRVIAGWSEGVPLLNEGGEIKLIIPSRLAFGNIKNGNIPAGSVLVFDIKLIATKEGIDDVNKKQIDNYLKDNNLTAQKSSSGLYYIIEEEGTGSRPNINSNITLKYNGQFLNGKTFDDNKGKEATFDLQGLIPGFQEGLLLFKEGGKGKLLIPSKLGYGFGGRGSISPGAVLVFDIELTKVN